MVVCICVLVGVYAKGLLLAFSCDSAFFSASI